MIVNRHSTVFFLGLVVAGAVYSGMTSGWNALTIAAVLVAAVGAWALVRYARRTATADIPAVLRGGKPVLVEFYSEF
ncbi:MAG: hypothetical protein RLZZ297_461 [Chloroflexota bacterium]|jgi:ABC-type nickel/cobalt efflux system permease component RcnA